MLRFIDLDKQIGLNEDWPREFAIYNTITDQFVTLLGSQVWNDRESFEGDVTYEYKDDLDMRERLLGLLPSWVPYRAL